jgi:tripartite-type tricarboxylate transporter receptor subunit TctC
MMYLDTERGAKFTRDSFTPIANHDTDPVAIGVAAKSPYKTLDDLIKAAKADPKKVTAGSNGVLAAGHLGLLQFEKVTGTTVTWTSFDDAGQLRTSVLGGSVDLEVQPVSELTTPKANGSMRILAILSDERLPGLDDVPTAKELGYPDAVVATNRILVGPKGLPQSIVDTLSASVKKSIGEASYQAQAKKRLLTLNYMTADETAAMWKGFDTTFAHTAQDFRAASK